MSPPRSRRGDCRETGAAAISMGVASMGAGVVEDRAMARLTMGVVGLAAAPVEPAAAAAGDWTEVACWVVVYSGACQGSKACSDLGRLELPFHEDGRRQERSRRGCRAAVRSRSG